MRPLKRAVLCAASLANMSLFRLRAAVAQADPVLQIHVAFFFLFSLWGVFRCSSQLTLPVQQLLALIHAILVRLHEFDSVTYNNKNKSDLNADTGLWSSSIMSLFPRFVCILCLFLSESVRVCVCVYVIARVFSILLSTTFSQNSPPRILPPISNRPTINRSR